MPINLQPGTLLAQRYEALRELGAGGMGEVWCCLDRRSQREVALKRVRVRSSHDGNSRLVRKIQQFFIEEVRALASLSHPNLVRALDFGQLSDSSPYLVMEYIDGLSLDHIWKHERVLPWHLLAAIVDQLLQGLAHIHARGILHRDLKPANILLARGPQDEVQVHLVDFGIAIVDHALDDFRPQALLESQGLPTVGLGTPPYIAPEQILAKVRYRGPCTDLHAVGVLLYQFSSGNLPYWSEKPGEMIRNVVYQPPPVLHAVNDSPLQLQSLLLTLLAKVPWERGTFAAGLRKVLRPLWDPQQAHRDWLRLLWRRGESLTDSYDEIAPPEVSPHTTLMTAAESGVKMAVNAVPFEPTPSPNRDEAVDIGTLPWGAFVPQEPGLTLAGHAPTAAHEQISEANVALAFTEGAGGSLSLLSLQIPTVVGREEEQAHLWEEVGCVSDGGRRLVVLEGPAGIGKSRLAQWLQEQTHEHGILLGLKARIRRGDSQQAAGLLGALAHHLLLDGLDRAGVEKALETRWGQGAAVRRLVHGLVELLCPTPYEAQSPQALAWHQPHRRNALLRDCLAQVADGFPLYIWLDDIHHIDEEDAALLVELLEKGPPLLMLGTCQRLTDEPLDQPGLLLLLGHEQTRQMQLQRLPDTALEQLLQGLLPLAPRTAEALATGSDGNPLFLIQQLFSWLQQGQLFWVEDRRWYAAPSTLHQHMTESRRELWRERLGTLPSDLQRAARAAATLGPTFSLGLLEQLLEALGLAPTCSHALVAQQLLILEREHLSWSHDLIEAFVRDSLAQETDASDIHRAAAKVLAKHPLHFTRRVVRLRVSALDRGGEIDAACELLFGFLENAWKTRRNSLHLRADLALLSQPLSAVYEAQRARWEAEAALLSSSFERATAAAQSALSAFLALEDAAGVTEARRILGAIAAGRSLYPEALEHLEAALAGAEALELPESIAQIQLLLAHTYQYMSRLHESARCAREAYTLAETWNVNTVLIQSCLIQATTHHDLGEHTEARLWADICLDACRLGAELYGEGQAHVLLAWLDILEEEHASAIEHCDAACRCLEGIDEWWWSASARVTRGWACAWSGDREAAQALAAETREVFLAHQMPHESGQTWLLTATAQLLGGDYQAAAAAIQCAKEQQRAEPMMKQPLALLEAWLAQGEQRFEDAERSLRRAISIWQQLGLTTFGVPRLLQALGGFSWPEDLRALLDAWRSSFA